MLYFLGQFGESLAAFNVFRYITFRTAGAVVTALFFVFMFGPTMIAALRIRQGKGQPIREDGPAGHLLTKTDPFGFAFEHPPQTASVVRDVSRYQWQDEPWMSTRQAQGAWLERPMSIYEVHLGSWARVPEDGNRVLTFKSSLLGSAEAMVTGADGRPRRVVVQPVSLAYTRLHGVPMGREFRPFFA
ncbi:MAG: hypothetical protein ABL879_17235, partial [Devosia sp.]